MGTTAEKLTYLNTTKAKIRTGLNNIGAELTESDTFRSYANALADIYDELPKVSDEGTDLELSNTKKGKLAITPKGNSSQFSTTGKNLLNPTITSTTKNGVTLSYNSTTQEITLNGTCDTNNTTFNFTGQSNTIPANTTIYSRLKYISGSSTGKLILQIFDSGFSKNAVVSTDSGLSADITNSTSYSSEVTFSVNRIRVDSGSSFTNLKFQVYLSTVDSEYELFTGKSPAPNPDYPYPVKTVTGENSVEICNENLFDKNDITSDSYLNSDGDIISNTNWCISDYIPVIAGEDYIYRGLTNVGNAPMSCYYDKNKQFISSFKQNATATRITIPTNVKYVRFTIENKNTDNIDTFIFFKGSTIIPFVEHQSQTYQLSLGNIELNSSPDGIVRDGIIGTPNNWFKREYIGKVVLDGTESGWTLRGTDTNTYRFTNDTVIANALAKNNTSLYFCNEFQIYAGNSGIAPIDDNGIALRDSLNGFTIRILKTLVNGLDNFKTWLSNHNAIGYYLLATPVDIPITDTTLINQLNDIYNNAHSYNGVTNITTTYEDGNEQMVLDASALKSWSDSNE